MMSVASNSSLLRPQLSELCIPAGYKILIVEDSDERIHKFRSWLPDAVITRTEQEATALLRKERFDLIFLDHDLGTAYAYESFAGAPKQVLKDCGNGLGVAKILFSLGHDGSRVVVHSHNPPGARDIQRLLPKCRLMPFGTFSVVGPNGPRWQRGPNAISRKVFANVCLR
jgi:CheY-like chemotaxis protein